jgi:hypothetical protein
MEFIIKLKHALNIYISQSGTKNIMLAYHARVRIKVLKAWELLQNEFED